MPSRLTGFVCPTVSMVTTGHATVVEKTLLQVDRRYLPALAPHSLTTQVTDQWKFAGQAPEWSDCEVPALVGSCNLPVIKWQVLGLPFSTAIFRTLPIGTSSPALPKRTRYTRRKKPSVTHNTLITILLRNFAQGQIAWVKVNALRHKCRNFRAVHIFAKFAFLKYPRKYVHSENYINL